MVLPTLRPGVTGSRKLLLSLSQRVALSLLTVRVSCTFHVSGFHLSPISYFISLLILSLLLNLRLGEARSASFSRQLPGPKMVPSS